MTVEESHFQVAEKPKSARSTRVKIFTTRQESRFQAAEMMKSRSPEVMYSLAKVLMTLELSHFQAAKIANRGFVDAR
jgi:hypothetical protein